MFRLQAQQSTVGKPCIRPALINRTLAFPSAIPSPLQQTPQPSSHVAINDLKRLCRAVLEVSIPTAQRPIQVRHDFLETTPVQPRGLRSHPVFQLPKAFLPRPSHAALEVIPKEVKSSELRCVHHARLFRMQCQSRLRHPCLHRSEEHTSELQSPCNLVCRLL